MGAPMNHNHEKIMLVHVLGSHVSRNYCKSDLALLQEQTAEKKEENKKTGFAVRELELSYYNLQTSPFTVYVYI